MNKPAFFQKILPLLFTILLVLAAFGLLWDSPVPDEGGAGYAINRTSTQQTGSGIVGASEKSNIESEIGGEFTLTDTNGNTVTQEDLKGKYSLVYFGFTSCPDICPTTLLSITQALESIGEEADNITPVFITVDPARDTVGVMREYRENFHENLLALTGTPEQIDAAANAYKVFYKLHNEEDKENYIVDHTGYAYLMNPDGNYITHFTHDDSAEQIMVTLVRYLR